MSKSKLDTVVDLGLNEHSEYIYTNARWLKMREWLESQDFNYTAIYVPPYFTTGNPYSVVMEAQDAIIFKLVFSI